MMDDLMLNSGKRKPTVDLFSLKGKDWSSLQNLDTDESDESSGELSPSQPQHQQNGYLDLEPHAGQMMMVNGEYSGDKYVHSSDESSQPVSSGAASQPDKHFLCDTTKLKREDMDVFGLRPAYDQFFLVVCEHCKGVYKPQALIKHIETRHSGGAADLRALNHTTTIELTSTAVATPSMKPTLERDESSSLTGDAFSASHQANTSHNLRSLLASTTSKDDLDLLKPTGLSAGKLKSSFRGLDSKSNSSANSSSSSPLAALSDTSLIKRTPAVKPKLLPCKDRRYDPNVHCGVRVPEDAAPCTRSLTCKTHSLTLRRSVPGRRDSFDRLLDEHRTAKEAALRAAGLEVKPTKLQLKKLQKQQQQIIQLKAAGEQAPPLPPLEIGSIALKDNQSITNQSIINKTSSPPSSACSVVQTTISTANRSPGSIAARLPSTAAPLLGDLSNRPFRIGGIDESNARNNNGLCVTAIQNPTNSFVNINSLQFSSPSPTVKQFTFGNVQPPPQPAPASLLPSSIQVINTTASMANSTYQHNNHHPANGSLPTPPPPPSNSFLICDLNPATIAHYPKPAAVCTFNERRLSIFTQSSNKKILSSKMFDRKKDYALSALSILSNCNRTEPQQPITPVKQTNRPLSNSSSNSNSQDGYSTINSFQGGRSLLKGPINFQLNGLSPNRKDQVINKGYL